MTNLYPFVLVPVYSSSTGVLKPWPVGQICPTEPCHPVHWAPHGPENLVAGKQLQH